MSKKTIPPIPWQQDEYKRHAEFSFTVPSQFLILCKLMDITPKQMLTDFMDNISCGSWKRKGRDQAKEKLIDYFIEHGYGAPFYSPQEIRSIFAELNAIGMLYPFNASEELINEHTAWRANYHKWWFEKWYKKNNRDI